MVKKQIIGSVLILFALLELFALEIHRSVYKSGVYGFTAEMFYFFIGVFVFLAVLATGTIVLRKKILIYSSMSWAITSIIVGILAFWTFILAKNPTEKEWGGFAQLAIYYIIGSLLSQTAVSLAVLAVRTSRELKSNLFSVVMWFCLVFSSAIILLYIGSILSIYIGEKSNWDILLYGILLDTVPLCVIVPLILFILKEKNLKQSEN